MLHQRSLWLRSFPLAFLLAGLAVPGSAQETGGISGQVTDASGAALAHATVAVRQQETGAERQIVTDNAGRYDVPSLPVGNYSVTASLPGFKSATKTGIRLVVGQAAQESLSLEVGDLQQVVTVEEKPEVVSVSTQQTSGLVGEKQVKDLPLNGRSYDELLLLNPGIVNYSSEKSGGIGTSNSAVGNMFSVSGRRPQESIFLLNGVEYTSASQINLTPGGASGQLLGVDAVREFNVLTDFYGAEYGKRPGAQVSIVTSSGSNQIHGAAYEFLRNSALDARNFFDQKNIAPFKRNEFGAALSGPIQKDKTFVFGNYEGFRQSLGLSDATLVPDTCARKGFLSNTSGACTTAVGLSPASANLLSLWPLQNGPELGGGIAYSYSNPIQRIREDFGTTRVDHVFSNADTLSGIYTVDDSADNTPTANPFTTVIETLREQVASVQETHVFSPRVVNTATFGFSRGAFFFTSQAPDVGTSWISGQPIGAVIIGGGTGGNGATQISNAGTQVTSNTVAVRNLFTYTDQVNITLGAHQLQAGVWLQRIQANDTFAQAQYGQASFASLSTFLQGNVGTFTAVPSTTPLGWRSTEGAGYVQDTIRFNKRLEVKLGFRFESTNGWNESHGRAANYLFGPGGVLLTDPSVGSSALAVNRAKFLPQPRVGFAWDPFGHGNTVLRAGFGLYNALLDDLSYRLDQNAPFNTTLSLKNVALSSLNITPGAPLPPGGLISPAGVQPDMFTPTVISWNFRVEQKLSSSTSLGLGYVGSHGYHEILSVDANEPYPTICPASPCPSSLGAGTVYYPKGAPLANPNLANSTTWLSEGLSSYNAFNVDVNRRFSGGLQVRGVYTFSKSLDNGGTLATAVGANAPAFVMYPGNTKLDWGLSTFDVRNLGVINSTYDLPFGRGRRFGSSAKGWVNTAVGGWSVAGVLTLQSGFPFTPQLGFNPTNNGDSRNPIRPSLNPSFTGPVILGSPNRYYDPNAFVVPPNGTYGNVGRDVLPGPGLATFDFSALKNFKVTEKVKLQFRSEFFNILNHTNFSTPNPVVFTSANSAASSTAGTISATSTTSRQIQFGLKLLW
jgi:Carboxypeptidase regulatory-like domain